MSSRKTLAFALLAIVQATLIFTITLIAIPLPSIGLEFGRGSADLVLVTSAYGLPFSGLLLFGGRLVDRYGGRFILVAGLVLFGLASLSAPFTPSFEALVGVRFLQGVGAALIAPAAMAVLRTVFTEPRVFRKAMATWGGVSVLGAALGIVLSGAMTTWISWRWMFIVPLVVVVATLAATSRLFPAQGPADAAGRPGLDPLGAALATLGITIASYGLIRSGDHAWASSTVMLPFLVGLLLLLAFFIVERRAGDPLLPPRFLSHPARAVGAMGIMLASSGSGLLSFVMSLYLQQERGWTPLETAGAFVPFTVALIATSRMAARLVSRHGAGTVTVGGLFMGASGLALLAAIGPQTSFVLGLMPGLILVPAGASLMSSGSAVLSTKNVPRHQIGLAGGVMNTGMELGPTVGLAFYMSVAATRSDVITGYGWAFGTAAVVYIAAAIGALIVLNRRYPPARRRPA